MRAQHLIETLVHADEPRTSLHEQGFSSQDKGEPVRKAFKGGGEGGGRGEQVAPEPKAGSTTGSDHTTTGKPTIKDEGQPVKKAFKGAGSGERGQQVAAQPKSGSTTGKDYTTSGKPTIKDEGQPVKKAMREHANRFNFGKKDDDDEPDDALIDKAASGSLPAKSRTDKKLGGNRKGGQNFSWRKKFGGEPQTMESGTISRMADQLLEAPPTE